MNERERSLVTESFQDFLNWANDDAKKNFFGEGVENRNHLSVREVSRGGGGVSRVFGKVKVPRTEKARFTRNTFFSARYLS